MDTINNTWCLNCGVQQWIKRGKTKDGRQRLKCKLCKKSITLNACLPGTKRFNIDKLLPVLRKNVFDLTKGEYYSLGILIADGGRKGKGNIDNMVLSITEADKQIVEIVHKELQFPNTIKHYSRNKGKYIENSCEISWSNKWAGKYWDSLGLVRNKTGNEQWMPYMNNWHFVRGFLDGDGCIYNGSRFRVEFYSASNKFLINLHTFIQSNILSNNKRKLYKKNKGAGDWFQLYYGDKDAKLICEFIYEDSDNLRLERKYKKYLEIKNNKR